MAATNASPTPPPPPVDSIPISGEELAAKSVHKRYEGLMMVRNKAIKGKGAWYWAHLEPVLVHNPETGFPKAVKLRCSLCDAVFSASNPSRTASEHLKRGACPNFNFSAKPISSVSPPSSVPPPPLLHHNNNRKRNSSTLTGPNFRVGSGNPYPISTLSIVDPSRFCAELNYSPSAVALPNHPPHTASMLSGGKEDLEALAMLEDSVKKLKSPKTSPGPILTKAQIDTALDYLADWVYESGGSVSFSSLEHPKFKSFLNQVNLPEISRWDFAGPRLNSKFEEAKTESELKIGDALFFQLASNGWKDNEKTGPIFSERWINLTVNLPNGTSLYQKAEFISGSVPSSYAEEILWEEITSICGSSVSQCVGLISDKFKSKALKNLEERNHWMVNLSCQFQAFISLIKDFYKGLPLFKSVVENCSKVANFINFNSKIRKVFHKLQVLENGYSNLLRFLPLQENCSKKPNFEPVYTMLEDILCSSRALQLVLLDESYKTVSIEEPLAVEVANLIKDEDGFWTDLEAIHSLIKLIKDMAQDIETERPLIGQCLPLWNELRSKAKDWCSKFRIEYKGTIEKVIEKRFLKNYHPSWAVAFILDPLYLIRDNSGKYLPPFKYLSPEQEKDVDKLITRLVSREEAHVALMELMKWRTEGLDPVYARAVQMRERDPISGKMRIVNPQSSRLVWETYLTEFKSLGKVAVRLIFLHATTCCGFKCNNWSLLRWICSNGRSRGSSSSSVNRARKLIFIAANNKLERRDFSSEEDKDAELFALANGEDDLSHES